MEMKRMELWKISKLMTTDRLFHVSEEQAVDVETGEVFDKNYLDNLPMEQAEKSKNIGLVIKKYANDIDEIDKELKRLAGLKKTYNARINSLKSYVLTYGCPVNDIAVTIKFSKGKESVEVDKGAEIPDGLKKWTWIPNKTEIAKALKAGEEIAGCKLIRKPSVSVK
nr:MAG TPA: resistance protein [Caudoviricetes sp.]